MYRRSQLPQNNMYNVYVFGYILLQFIVSVHLQVTFDTPPEGGATITISENETAGTGIYTLQATDPSGNVLVFSIVEQDPLTTPAFYIDGDSDNLVVPTGLDVDDPIITHFNFNFSVTAGSSSAISEILRVIVNDTNDNDPVFNDTTYTAEVWKNDPPDTTIANVSAYDPDRSNRPITYSIAGAQTTFNMSGSGVITLAHRAGLASLSSPTVLQVQASDGGRTGTAAVTITIHEDPCTLNPCQNGGTCNSTKDNYTCICLSGYEGIRCESVNYCYQNPCENGGTCNNFPTTYDCECPCAYCGQNCTQPALKCNASSISRLDNKTLNYVIANLEDFGDGTSLYTPTNCNASIDFANSSVHSNFTLDGTFLRATNGLDADQDVCPMVFTLMFIIQIETTNLSCPLTLNNPPVVSAPTHTGCILSPMAAGTTIIQVKATCDPANSNNTHSLYGEGSEFFSIDRAGLITSSRVLHATDKETYTITVKASDGINEANATVVIHVYEGNCSNTTIGSCHYDSGCKCSSNTNVTCCMLPATTTTAITGPTRNTVSTTNTGTSTTAIPTSTTAASTTTGTPPKCRCSSPKSLLDDWQLLVAIGVICGCVLVILVVLIIMCCCGDDDDREMTNIHKIPLHELIDEMLIHETGIQLTIDRGGRVIVRGYELLSWLSIHHKDQVLHLADLLLQHGYVMALDTHHHQIYDEGHYMIQLELIVDRMIYKTTGVSFKMSDNGPVFTGKDVLEWLMDKLRIDRIDDAITLANYMYQQKEILSVYGEADTVRWDSSPFMFGLQHISNEMKKGDTRLRIRFKEDDNHCFNGKDLIEWLRQTFHPHDEALAVHTGERLLHHKYITARNRNVHTLKPDKLYSFAGRQKPASQYDDRRREHMDGKYHNLASVDESHDTRAIAYVDQGHGSRAIPYVDQGHGSRAIPYVDQGHGSRAIPYVDQGHGSRANPYVDQGHGSRAIPYVTQHHGSRAGGYDHKYHGSRAGGYVDQHHHHVSRSSAFVDQRGHHTFVDENPHRQTTSF